MEKLKKAKFLKDVTEKGLLGLGNKGIIFV
jgi:hypothetical protein